MTMTLPDLWTPKSPFFQRRTRWLVCRRSRERHDGRSISVCRHNRVVTWKRKDKPDLAKGSFYFNRLTDNPGTEHDRASCPLSCPCNVWPDDNRIPRFEKAAKHLHVGRLMKDVVVKLSKHIDRYARERVAGYPLNALYDAMKQIKTA